MITRGRIVAAEAVFFAVSALVLWSALLILARVASTMVGDATRVAVSLLAAGLPIPIGIVAGRLAQGRGEERRVRIVLPLLIALGAVVVTAFGGFAAPFIYLSYFVAITLLMSVLRLRAGVPPFSLAMAAEIAAAVIVSAVVLGYSFDRLVNLITRIGR